ncbi:MAG: radical SAM protein [Bryobacteraceae bacterium]
MGQYPMFSDRHSELWHSLADGGPSEAEALATVNSAAPQDRRLAGVLGAAELGQGGALDRAILERSRRVRRELFANRVYAIVPVYVTSICGEDCLYCNYRSGNKGLEVERLRLTDGELAREAEHLIEEKGLRVLELVYATDPRVRVDSMCRQVELVRRILEQRGGGAVGISTEALEEAEYRRLLAAGLSFSVLWQETYDRERYGQLHRGATKKTNFAYRLDACERALSAGVRWLGMGVLSGLADWRRDWTMLLLHEDYLRRTRGREAGILGIPRLKPAPGAMLPGPALGPTTPEFIAAVALHGIYSPSTLPFVSTRESWETCVALAQGGGCLFTFNCSTIPGGYSLGHRGAQFQTASYDAPVFRGKLEQAGVEPEFAWSFDGTPALCSGRPAVPQAGFTAPAPLSENQCSWP